MERGIRKARSPDGAGIAAVYLLSSAKLGFLPRRHGAEDMWHHFRRLPLTRETWIARQGGRVAGFLALKPGWIDHLYVHPAHQGHGLGTVLLDLAKENTGDGFRLWTFRQNKSARRFYQRHGLRADLVTDGRGNAEHLPDMRYVWR